MKLPKFSICESHIQTMMDWKSRTVIDTRGVKNK